jgi:hypothetical protein
MEANRVTVPIGFESAVSCGEEDCTGRSDPARTETILMELVAWGGRGACFRP